MKKGAGAVAAWLVQLAGADDLLAVHDISKRKKVTSTECLSVDVRLEVSVQVKPSTYDVT